MVDGEKVNKKKGTAAGASVMAQPTLFHVAAVLTREDFAVLQSALGNSTQDQGCLSDHDDVSTAVMLSSAQAMRWNAR